MVDASQDITRKIVRVVVLDVDTPRVTDNSKSYYPIFEKSLVYTYRIGKVWSKENIVESIIELS